MLQYLKICGEMEFKPATERTLLIILEESAASTRQSRQGPNHYTGDGSEAFEHLEEVIEKLYMMKECLSVRRKSCVQWLCPARIT